MRYKAFTQLNKNRSKAKIILFAILICQLSFAQITQADIDNLRKIPKTYQLDILEQKSEGNQFITKNHRRYVVSILDTKIVNQKLNDTIYMESIEDRTLKYQYNKDNLLTKISFYGFQNNLKKEFLFNYLEGNLLHKTTVYKGQEEIEKITYNQDKCKPNYLTDLLDDSNSENPNEFFTCKTITTHKKISNYIFSIVKVFKIGTGKVKKIDLKGDKDTEISRFYTYNYDDNDNIIKVNLHRNDKIKTYKTNKYNDKGDIAFIKSGYSELYYTYKYDDHNNWIEKIETSKVKNKRRVFKRIFVY